MASMKRIRELQSFAHSRKNRSHGRSGGARRKPRPVCLGLGPAEGFGKRLDARSCRPHGVFNRSVKHECRLPRQDATIDIFCGSTARRLITGRRGKKNEFCMLRCFVRSVPRADNARRATPFTHLNLWWGGTLPVIGTAYLSISHPLKNASERKRHKGPWPTSEK